MAGPSDEDLLARVAVGGGDAFEAFTERHLSAIGGYARRMLGLTAPDDFGVIDAMARKICAWPFTAPFRRRGESLCRPEHHRRQR